MSLARRCKEEGGENRREPKYLLDKIFQLAKFRWNPALAGNEPINITLAHLEFKDEKGPTMEW
jgi:hypothetical protein